MTIRRAEIRSFSSQDYTATIRIAGSLAVWLSGIPVARNIPAAEMLPGRSCAVVFFDESNPQDAVVVAVYVS
jgi:hypothetical protein